MANRHELLVKLWRQAAEGRPSLLLRLPGAGSLGGSFEFSIAVLAFGGVARVASEHVRPVDRLA